MSTQQGNRSVRININPKRKRETNHNDRCSNGRLSAVVNEDMAK